MRNYCTPEDFDATTIDNCFESSCFHSCCGRRGPRGFRGATGPTGATAPSIYAQHGNCRNHAAFHYLKDN